MKFEINVGFHGLSASNSASANDTVAILSANTHRNPVNSNPTGSSHETRSDFQILPFQKLCNVYHTFFGRFSVRLESQRPATLT